MNQIFFYSLGLILILFVINLNITLLYNTKINIFTYVKIIIQSILLLFVVGYFLEKIKFFDKIKNTEFSNKISMIIILLIILTIIGLFIYNIVLTRSKVTYSDFIQHNETVDNLNDAYNKLYIQTEQLKFGSMDLPNTLNNMEYELEFLKTQIKDLSTYSNNNNISQEIINNAYNTFSEVEEAIIENNFANAIKNFEKNTGRFNTFVQKLPVSEVEDNHNNIQELHSSTKSSHEHHQSKINSLHEIHSKTENHINNNSKNNQLTNSRVNHIKNQMEKINNLIKDIDSKAESTGNSIKKLGNYTTSTLYYDLDTRKPIVSIPLKCGEINMNSSGENYTENQCKTKNANAPTYVSKITEYKDGQCYTGNLNECLGNESFGYIVPDDENNKYLNIIMNF